MSEAYERGMIDEQHAAVVIVKGKPQLMMRGPMGMLDGGMVVIVIVSSEVDVRGRQHGRPNAARY